MSWPLRIWIGIVVVILLAPTAIVIPMSFSGSSTFEFPPKEWSTKWYDNFFSSHDWTSSLITSIEVGLLVAVLATVLGVAAAFALDRTGFRGKSILRQLVLAPMIMPSIVVAISVYAVFLRWHLSGNILGFVLAHTTLAVPLVIVSVGTSLAGYDRTLERAAASLGAGPVTTFVRVMLPLIAPGVAAGFAFAFVTSLDEVVVALFLSTPEVRTLPVQMYDAVTLEINPTIAAASSLLVVSTTLVILAAQFFRPRRKAA
ncbi:MAG TPA: ABC transporter permease [Solirubrobacterales bacterium]